MSQDDWEHIQSYKQQFIDGSAIASIWTVDDVQSVMDKTGLYKELTEDQAKEVLATVFRNLDANEGINWDVIEYHLGEFVDRDGGGDRDRDMDKFKDLSVEKIYNLDDLEYIKYELSLFQKLFRRVSMKRWLKNEK